MELTAFLCIAPQAPEDLKKDGMVCCGKISGVKGLGAALDSAYNSESRGQVTLARKVGERTQHASPSWDGSINPPQRQCAVCHGGKLTVFDKGPREASCTPTTSGLYSGC